MVGEVIIQKRTQVPPLKIPTVDIYSDCVVHNQHLG